MHGRRDYATHRNQTTGAEASAQSEESDVVYGATYRRRKWRVENRVPDGVVEPETGW